MPEKLKAMHKQIIERLQKSALKNGVLVEERKNGHFHIRGKFLVNYYPFSIKKTVYVAGTGRGKAGVSPEQAVAMALKLPPLPKNSKKRKTNNSKVRKRLLVKSDVCVWCGKKLTSETATLEHLIPRSRGGLDNTNNYAVACKECNQSRGYFC